MNDDELRREYQRSKNDAAPDPHPEPEHLAALLDGTLTEAKRLEVLDHATRCATCGPELDLLRAASEGARAAERSAVPSRWMALAAAALILVGIGVLTLRGHRPVVVPDVMRGTHAAVAVIAPASGSTISAPVTLAWHAMPGAQSYRVELLTEHGEVVASWSTPDTALAVPDSVRIRSNTSYDMWVRALLEDRTEVSSPLVRFNVK